jgi:predicted N-acetyltransferase YhbS
VRRRRRRSAYYGRFRAACGGTAGPGAATKRWADALGRRPNRRSADRACRLQPVKIGWLVASPPVLALAPVSVAPEHQRRGHGSALIRWSLDRIAERGHPGVIVLGEPEFYARFGFRPAGEFGIQCPFDVPAAYFMAVELREGGLRSAPGLAEYRPEFAAVS